MKKLHFRRFFRQTTTTRGGSTAGPPPEHHHNRRESPTPAAHMCMADDMSTSPSTHPQIPPLHLSFPFLFPPLTLAMSLHQETLVNPWRLLRPTRPCSHSVTHVQKNPREIDTIFSRQSLLKHTQTYQAPGRRYHPPGRPVRLPFLFFHFHHFPQPISLRSLHEISSTHPIHYSHTLSTTIPSIYLHHKLPSIETSRVGKLGDKLELVEEEGSSRRLATYLESPRSCWPSTS